MPEKMARSERVDIAIIGGGMVGLSLALTLEKALPEVSICLVEKQPLQLDRASELPSFDSRATALSLGSVGLLKSLGAWQDLEKNATAIRRVLVSDQGHFGRVSYTNPSDLGGALGYIVHNNHLGQSLIRCMQNTSVKINAPGKVTKVSPLAEGVALELEDSSSLHCELLVVADGADSSLRKLLGINADSHDYQQHAIIANVEFEKAHEGRAFERFTGDGPMALLPLGASDKARRGALVWTRPAEKVDQVMSWNDDEFLDNLHQSFGYRLGLFKRVGKRVNYPLHLVFAKEQVRSNLVLLGNAAHFLHPVAGQGFNLALRDVMQLSGVLNEAQKQKCAYGDLKVLQRYIERQSLDQGLTTKISHNFNRLFSNDKQWLQAIRNFGLLGMEIFPIVKQDFFAQMMGKTQKQAQMDFVRGVRYGG